MIRKLGIIEEDQHLKTAKEYIGECMEGHHSNDVNGRQEIGTEALEMAHSVVSGTSPLNS